MRRFLWRGRMALGGAVWGTFGGVVIGAGSGVVYSMVRQEWSYGLDWALFGAAMGACLGAIWGLFLGWHESSWSDL